MGREKAGDYLFEHNTPIIAAEVHGMDTIHHRRLPRPGRSRFEPETLRGIMHSIAAGQRQGNLLALGDQCRDNALQVVHPLAHRIPTRVALGDGPVPSLVTLLSAELASILLVPGCAVLAGLLPVAFQPVTPSAITRSEVVLGRGRHRGRASRCQRTNSVRTTLTWTNGCASHTLHCIVPTLDQPRELNMYYALSGAAGVAGEGDARTPSSFWSLLL